MPFEFDQARTIVIDAVRSLPTPRRTETLPLERAHGRILSEDVLADRDYPALDRSLRDGFAIRSKDVPGTLRVAGEVRAGDRSLAPLVAGHALEIMTGAPVPPGADAVVMVERTSRVDYDQVRMEQAAEPGQFINRRGAEAPARSRLIPAGTRLDASHVAALAMTGHTAVSVFTLPSVAILATGDEIVALGERPAAHQIRKR